MVRPAAVGESIDWLAGHQHTGVVPWAPPIGWSHFRGHVVDSGGGRSWVLYVRHRISTWKWGREKSGDWWKSYGDYNSLHMDRNHFLLPIVLITADTLSSLRTQFCYLIKIGSLNSFIIIVIIFTTDIHKFLKLMINSIPVGPIY